MGTALFLNGYEPYSYVRIPVCKLPRACGLLHLLVNRSVCIVLHSLNFHKISFQNTTITEVCESHFTLILVIHLIKDHCTNFTNEQKCVCHMCYNSAYENSCIMSPVALGELCPVRKNKPDDVLWVVQAWAWRLHIYGRKPVTNQGMEFKNVGVYRAGSV